MRSRRLTGIILTVLIVLSVLSLAAAKRDLNGAKDLTQTLEAGLENVTAQNAVLREKIETADTDESQEALIRSRLGLVKPEDIIFKDIH